MNENEFEIDGTSYVAIEDTGYEACKGCAFSVFGTGCSFAPGCVKEDRHDGRDVIFVEVKNERAKG